MHLPWIRSLMQGLAAQSCGMQALLRLVQGSQEVCVCRKAGRNPALLRWLYCCRLPTGPCGAARLSLYCRGPLLSLQHGGLQAVVLRAWWRVPRCLAWCIGSGIYKRSSQGRPHSVVETMRRWDALL